MISYIPWGLLCSYPWHGVLMSFCLLRPGFLTRKLRVRRQHFIINVLPKRMLCWILVLEYPKWYIPASDSRNSMHVISWNYDSSPMPASARISFQLKENLNFMHALHWIATLFFLSPSIFVINFSFYTGTIVWICKT